MKKYNLNILYHLEKAFGERICFLNIIAVQLLYFWAFFPPHPLLTVLDSLRVKCLLSTSEQAGFSSLWCVMNILLYCYVIYAQGLGLKAPSLHPLIIGSSAWSVLINWVFIVLYKQEHSAIQLEVISGWLLMILKTG